MGGTVGDDPKRVMRNKLLAFEAVGREPSSIHDVWQVHSSEVVCVDKSKEPGFPYQKADAMVTDKGNVTLFMRFADCVPIFLYDPLKEVAGLIHSGWQGTVGKVAVKTIHKMIDCYGCKPENILAGIGPSICAHHYPIGHEVEKSVRDSFGVDADRVLKQENGEVKFNLWEANRILLKESGLKNIEIAEICTACQPEDWYSHRGEAGRTGRFGALISLAS
jgi:hypothetical protein